MTRAAFLASRSGPLSKKAWVLLACTLLLSSALFSQVLMNKTEALPRKLTEQNMGQECVPFRTAMMQLDDNDMHSFRLTWMVSDLPGIPALWTAPISATDFWLQYYAAADRKKEFNALLGSTKAIIALADVLAKSKHSVVIDGGANMGQEAILFGLKGYEVHTFEPLPGQYANLKFNLRLNCVDVFAYNYGLGSQSHDLCVGEETSNRLSGNTAGASVSSLTESQEVDICPPERKIKVSTIDSIVTPKLSARPVLLKLDCEGCEYEALQGSRELLTKLPPLIINREVLNAESIDKTIDLLHSFAYSVYFLGPADIRVTSTYPWAYWSEEWKSRPLLSGDDVNSFYSHDSHAWELLAVHKDARDLLNY